MCDIYSSPSFKMVIKSRPMTWALRVACTDYKHHAEFQGESMKKGVR